MTQQLKGILGSGFFGILLFFSGLFIWLTPVPILYRYHQNGRGAALGAVAVSMFGLAALYFALVPWVVSSWGHEQALKYLFWIPGLFAVEGGKWLPSSFGLSYFLFYATVGFTLGIWERREVNTTRLVARVLAVLLVGVLFWLFIESGAKFGSYLAQSEQYLTALFEKMTQSPEGAAIDSDQQAFIKMHGQDIIYYAVRLIPGMFLAMSIFVIWLNMVVCRRLFVKTKTLRYPFFARLGEFKDWQLPFGFVWALIGFVSLLLADLYFFKVAYLKFIALNALIIFALIYFFQGLAILSFYGKRFKLPPLVKLLFYIVFLLFFQPIALVLLGFGFFDSWFNFRKLALKSAGEK